MYKRFMVAGETAGGYIQIRQSYFSKEKEDARVAIVAR
jgi:hypothetical protein